MPSVFAILQIWLFMAFIPINISIPIDNGVEGEPEIECGSESIEVTFKTRNAFNGRLYVKGRYGDGDCQNEQIGRVFTGITLSFGTCNVQRLRSLNPKGIFASTTIVISFHPMFVTKVDRVYKVQCFYMEAEKSVSQGLEVSDITTSFVTQLVPMPVCRYEVLEGGPSGQPIHFAVVGQQVYHKWTCDSETIDTFCMIVHSCVVDDGNNDTVPMLDEKGCALDRYVLNNLEYPTDLMAGQEAHVFKYADRSMLSFQCKISISLKEQAGECPRPSCDEPSRGKREIRYSLSTVLAHSTTINPLIKDAYDIDVSSQEIDTLEQFSLHSSKKLNMENLPYPLIEEQMCISFSIPRLFFFSTAYLAAVVAFLSFYKRIVKKGAPTLSCQTW